MTADDLGPGPTVLLDVLTTYRDLLREHEDEINALNVFPVADGDTGTNVLLTVEAALGLVGTAQPERPAPDLVALCDQLSHGALLGARGSSGVIASQALVAALDSLARAGHLDSASVAAALADARDAAYTAVAHPVEGTILTVLSAAAAAARTASDLPLPDPHRAPRAGGLGRRPYAPPRCCRSSPPPALWTPVDAPCPSASMHWPRCSAASRRRPPG